MVAGFLFVSVFVPLLKGRFFGSYVNGVTLADGRPFPWGSLWLQLVVVYGTIAPTKVRIIYAQNPICLLREYLPQSNGGVCDEGPG